jgi:hypothetical protein
MGEQDYARIGAIPMTTAARLVVDLLGERPVEAVFAVADDVLHRRWATPASIRRCWADTGKRHGSVLDAVLLPWVPGPKPGIPKEMALARVLQLHGLPRPLRQVEVRLPGKGPRFLDLAYPEARVAPEYDGRRDHGVRRWASDATREDELAAIGWIRLPAGAADLVEPGRNRLLRARAGCPGGSQHVNWQRLRSSARGPAEAPTPEHVEVEVRDRVPGDLADVEHEPVPVRHQALGAGDGLGSDEQVGDFSRVPRRDVIGARDVGTRHHEDVGRSLRVEVTEGVAALRRQHFGRRDVTTHNAAEQAGFAHVSRTLPLPR